MSKRSLKSPTKKLRDKLWKHSGECFFCRRPTPWKKRTGDHLFPFAEGYNAFRNIVPSCDKCNRGKGDRMPTFDEIERAQALYDAVGEVFAPRHLDDLRMDSPANLFNRFAHENRLTQGVGESVSKV